MTTLTASFKSTPGAARPVKRQPRLLVVPVLLLAAAFPKRYQVALGPLASVSVFDLAVAFAAVDYMFLLTARRAAARRVGLQVVSLAVATGVAACASLLWSRRVGKTVVITISHAEGLLVYLYLLAVFRGRSPVSVLRHMGLFVLSLLVPPILLLQHVPGFAPPAELDHTSGDYISYFVRLSHPFIGRSNNLATLLAFFVLPFFYWGLTRHSRSANLMAIVAFGAVVLTFSRGVLIGLVVGYVGLATAMPLLSARAVRRAILGLCIAVLGGYLLFQYNDTTHVFLAERLTTAGVDNRLQLLDTVGRIFNGRWWIGSGANADISVHNTFLQQFVDYGLFIGVFTSVFFIRAARFFFGRESDDATRLVGWSFVGLLVSCLFESSFEGTLLQPLIFLCLGLGVAFAQAIGASREHGVTQTRSRGFGLTEANSFPMDGRLPK